VTQLFTGHYAGDIVIVNQKRRGTDPCGSPDTTGIVLRTGFHLQLLLLVSYVIFDPFCDVKFNSFWSKGAFGRRSKPF